MFDRVEVSKLDGSDRKVLFSTRLINPRSIVVHPGKGYVQTAVPPSQQPLSPIEPSGFFIVLRLLFFMSNWISQFFSFMAIFAFMLIQPRAITRTMKNHLCSRTMYWADWNRKAPKIEVSNMDGGSRRVFMQQKMGLPNGLTLDKRNDELCWTDARHGSISCANLDDGIPHVVYSAAM